jgi:septum formation protein
MFTLSGTASGLERSPLYKSKRPTRAARPPAGACNNFNMLVLASASPRRRELLTQVGYSFEVCPAHIPEDPREGEGPTAYVTRLAREKAEAVFRELIDKGKPGAVDSLVVLGADTTVTLDGHILGKPEDAADAALMLRMLSGRTHEVITGVAVVMDDKAEIASEVTEVRFRDLNDVEIASYVATREPMDKAGAYAIQGLAARWIPRVEGCYFNVVGLPLALVSKLLDDTPAKSDRVGGTSAKAGEINNLNG